MENNFQEINFVCKMLTKLTLRLHIDYIKFEWKNLFNEGGFL
jgi:hypothetical protein